ncbi:CD96 molecule [Willisornis vidua]|uniref:CD96 molecule n=1 Tax=Willisornis vidua TaxID=1566151 RepID=A0ABQ9DLY6_9PASS|nr:CD96 molecule [Willisornis vidua]
MAIPYSHTRGKKLILHKVSLSCGQSPVLQCTVGDPSWVIFRAHRLLPPPGAQRTNIQVNCLSSPNENTVVHGSTDKGENGRKEELVTKEPSCPALYRNSSALYRQRVFLGLNNALKIFPTKITDDSRVFSCHVLYHPERVQKSSTTVRVFAYPEISVSWQKGSVGTSQKPSVICVMRKAFPKPTLMWYMDRVKLAERPGEPQSTSLASLDVTSLANVAPVSVTPGNLSYSITDQTTAVTRGKVFFTTSSLLNSTGDERNTKASQFPWPTVIAVLILFCSSLVAMGIRKWCQYQKEIVNRPPSSKSPPPPIKYTSMVESDGTPPSCHELENL